MSNPEEDAWRQIVEHYGDAPEFPDDEPIEQRDPQAPQPPAPPSDHIDEDGIEDELNPLLEDEGFVPPEPPPVPRPQGARLLAWLGVFCPPGLLLLSALADFRLADFVSTLLVVWFLTGFGYLVWQMPRDREDPWDDGARL